MLLGCDLIYDAALVPSLVKTVDALLPSRGHFFYVSGGKRHVFCARPSPPSTPKGTGIGQGNSESPCCGVRQGAKEFITALRDLGYVCHLHPCLDAYKENPLVWIKLVGLGFCWRLAHQPEARVCSGQVGKTQAELELHFNELFDNQQVTGTSLRLSPP